MWKILAYAEHETSSILLKNGHKWMRIERDILNSHPGAEASMPAHCTELIGCRHHALICYHHLVVGSHAWARPLVLRGGASLGSALPCGLFSAFQILSIVQGGPAHKP